MSDDEQRYTEERRQANYKRTLRGAAILTRYHEMTGSAEDSLTDLLTDLMHVSAIPKAPISFADALEQAQQHYAAEVHPMGDGIP